MTMHTVSRRWTPAEVRALTEEQPAWWPRYELIDGELLVTPSPRPAHQRAHSRVFQALVSYVAHEKIGVLLSSPSDISLTADTIVQPDLFVTRFDEGRRAQQWSEITHLVLAVEVLSPATAQRDRGEKRELYQHAHVDEYWIVDADARMVERWRPDDACPEILRERLTWHPQGGAQPLIIELRDLFDP